MAPDSLSALRLLAEALANAIWAEADAPSRARAGAARNAGSDAAPKIGRPNRVGPERESRAPHAEHPGGDVHAVQLHAGDRRGYPDAVLRVDGGATERTGVWTTPVGD